MRLSFFLVSFMSVFAFAAPFQKEGPVVYPAKHVSISIERSPSDVYDFAVKPENLPKWAAGLSGSIVKLGGDWIADSPMGKVKVKFADKNHLGVLDHDVTLPSGETVHNPMRVLKNNRGSEVVFTVYRRPGVSDEEFARDSAAVERDLKKLKSLLEK